MKKKLLVTGLVFCCVWGVFASKLTDAAASGDFDTMKKQIELLDADISDLNTALAYCLSNWRFDDGHEKCLKFLTQKGASISDNTLTRMIKYSGYVLLDYLLRNKYLDINSKVYFDDGYNRATVSLIEYAIYLTGNRSNREECDIYLTAFVLTTYKPYVSDNPYFDNVSPVYWLFTGNISKLRAWIKESESGSFQSNFMGSLTAYWPAYLFIQDQKVLDWLNDVDQMAPTYGFTGSITSFYINEIVPKYMSHITSQEDLEFMQFIINYNASMDYDNSMAKVKAYIEKVGSLEHSIQAIGWSPVFLLPFKFENIDAVKLLLDAKSNNCNVYEGEKKGANTYNYYYSEWYSCGFIEYWNKDNKLSENDKVSLSDSLYNELKKNFEPIRIERERIANEKAEKKKKVAEEKFKSEFLPQYKYELRNNIITHFGYYFKQAKGKYILKKNYKGIMEQSIKSTINPICLEYPDSYLIGNQKIYKDQYYGITEEFITKQCAKVGEEVLEEFGIK